MKKHLLETALLGAFALGCGNADQPAIAGPGSSTAEELPPIAQPYTQNAPTRVIVGDDEDRPHVSYDFHSPDAPEDEFLPSLRGPGYHDLRARETSFDVPAPVLANPEADAPELEDARYVAGDLCTFSAEAWGGSCAGGDAAACLRDAEMELVFPNGIELGQRDRIVLTDAKAVAAALPAKGAAEPVSQSIVDPAASQMNTLAAELVALRLNLAFNAAGRIGEESLAEARLLVGPLAGYSIEHVSEIAEGILSGNEYGALGIHLDAVGMAAALEAINALAADCNAVDALGRPAR